MTIAYTPCEKAERVFSS